MNTTSLRADVRNRLSDPSPGLWSDAQLDTALARAFGQVAPLFPVEVQSVVTVAAAARSIPKPADALTIVALLNAADTSVYRYDGDRARSDPYSAQSWRPYAARIELSRAVLPDEAGPWTLSYMADPVMPPTPSTVWAIPDTVAGAIVALAAASLLRSRIADDAKRGHHTAPIVERTAEDIEAEAIAVLAVHRRRARPLR